jgi:hypothetical protein
MGNRGLVVESIVKSHSGVTRQAENVVDPDIAQCLDQ